MLQLTPANVGTAPGTTTLTIPRAEMRPSPRSLEGALGTVYPTDFDLSRMYGYLPYNTGWISGKMVNPPPQPQGVMVLSEAASAASAAIAALPPEQQMVALQTRAAQLEVEAREEQLRTERHNRIWNAVTGLVAIGGLVVSVIALKRS